MRAGLSQTDNFEWKLFALVQGTYLGATFLHGCMRRTYGCDAHRRTFSTVSLKSINDLTSFIHSHPSFLSFFIWQQLFSSSYSRPQVEFIYLYLLISKRAALLFSQWTAYYVIFLCLSLKYLRFSHCLALPCASSIAIALLGDGPGVAFRSTLPRIATAADVTPQLPALHAAQSHLRTHEPWRHSATPRGTYMHWRLYIPSPLTHNNNNNNNIRI